MSLADRLDSVRRTQSPATSAGEVNDRGSGRRRKAQDPYAGVKGRVHQSLI